MRYSLLQQVTVSSNNFHYYLTNLNCIILKLHIHLIHFFVDIKDIRLILFLSKIIVFILPYILSELNQRFVIEGSERALVAAVGCTYIIKSKSTILHTECQSEQLRRHDEMKTFYWLVFHCLVFLTLVSIPFQVSVSFLCPQKTVRG